MTGLKICTRSRAISARRSRRISSSLLPENIGPTITSIQPMLPLTMSTVAPPPPPLTLAHSAVEIHARRTWRGKPARHIPAARRRCSGTARDAEHQSSGVAIQGRIEKRREGIDHGDAEGILARDEVAG